MAQPAAPLRPKLDLDISTDLGSNFLFSGFGLSSRLAGEVRITAQGRDLPRASGTIRTRSGRFDAYGQKLDIERGVLTFNGLLDNPGSTCAPCARASPSNPVSASAVRRRSR
jgi:translocation and assembly module TamB